MHRWIDPSKKEIIQTGLAFGVDYSLTISCYQADELGRACGVRDPAIRKTGFEASEKLDPTHYRT